MPNPSLWMMIAYILTAPFAATLRTCLIGRNSGERNMKKICTACILGFYLLVSAINGIDGILNMFHLMIPIFCFALWCPVYFALDCVSKKARNELDAWDIVWALSCYFAFLVLVVFMAPQLRWCEGCIEWH